MLGVHLGHAPTHWRRGRCGDRSCVQEAQHPAHLHAARRTAAAAASGSGSSAPAAAAAAAAAAGPPVLVVPAFYTDAQVFRPLVEELRMRGYNAALPPIRWTDWVPTLGGRSVRPILDRMDYALTQLLQGCQVSPATDYEVPLPPPTRRLGDWVAEFRDASAGAQPPLPLTGRWQGDATGKAALVASSAAGWISRIFLAAGPPYSSKVYHGADRVHTLVTLGTPHTSAEAVTRRNIDFVNNSYPGAHMPGVRYVAVGSRAVPGRAYLGVLQDFAFQSYSICCGRGDVWGDGVTPVECAVALPGAEHIVLEGAKHTPLDTKDGSSHWYGSGPYLDAWVAYLDDPGAAAGGANQGRGADAGRK